MWRLVAEKQCNEFDCFAHSHLIGEDAAFGRGASTRESRGHAITVRIDIEWRAVRELIFVPKRVALTKQAARSPTLAIDHPVQRLFLVSAKRGLEIWCWI